MDSSRPHELGILNFVSSSLSLGSQTLMQTLLYQFSTQRYIDFLAQRFSIKDLGVLSYFLGIEVLTTPSGVLLTQRRYISDLLARTKMSGAKPVATPLVIDGNLTLHLGTTLTNCTEYRTIVGSLQYLCLTHLDLSYVVNKLSQFMHRPTSKHWNATKRSLQYLWHIDSWIITS
ncbi:hypothetical protein AAG906_039417 [Vitis piasezkii]